MSSRQGFLLRPRLNLPAGLPDRQTMGVAPKDDVRIIRPAAILDERAANRVLDELKRLDIGAGGVWNATSSLWQRYDTPWDGMGGTRGNARLLGSIAVMYDAPNRHQITIYKVTVTPYGLEVAGVLSLLSTMR